MPAAAWVTLAITALIIAPQHWACCASSSISRPSGRRSAPSSSGVWVVAHQTRTVPEVVPSVNASLKPVRDFCESV